tara:strand:- start:6043 stop:13296 length:7254 start_codon:yes stop_codon:yes gene_type:complete
MAESKFLKFQDVDRDGVIDVCDDDLTTPELPCKGPCVPDPIAIVPSWRNQSFYEPFLNERICHFQITKVTPYRQTAGEVSRNTRDMEATDSTVAGSGVIGSAIDERLEKIFEEFRLEAARNLLDFCPIGARLNNDETLKIVYDAIQFKKYDLEARPNSQLKLLYSVPFDVIYNIADPPNASEPEEDDEGPGWEKVTYKGDSIMTDSIRVRKGLYFYSKLLKVSSQVGEGDAYYIDSEGNATHKFFLENIGDPAILTSGLLSTMIDQLKGFLAGTGASLPTGVKGDPFGPIFREKVTKIQFSFKDKKLRVLKVYTEECGDKPSVYNFRSGALRSLVGNGQPTDGGKEFHWNNETLVNYFINLKPMATFLNARTEQPWRGFLEQYTYPPIKVTHLPVNNSISTCIRDAFRDEMNEMGNDVLDEIFGLGDLVAYLYNDTLCRNKLEEVMNDEKEMNALAPDTPDDPFGREVAAILAKNQRWTKLAADDDVVLRLCVNALAPIANGAGELASKVSGGTIPLQTVSGPGGGGPSGNLKDLWREAFESLKLCGLLDLLFDSLGCLMGGMTLDSALPIIIRKALEAMGIEQFGDLFVGLPPEKQAEMDALVEKKLKEMGKSGDVSRPWDNPDVIAAERVATSPANLNNYESVVPASYSETMSELTSSDRTVLSQLDSVGNEDSEANVDSIMQVYLEALIETYTDNLIVILDELGNFPGAPLIRDVISLTALSCPRPPLMNPGPDDFIKSLGLAFCRSPKEIVIPQFNQKLELKISFKDMLKPLFKVAQFLAGMIIIIVVNQLLAKLCEILTRAVCKALETTGDLVMGLPGAIAGTGPSLREIIRENICGPDVGDKVIDDTVVELMSVLGLGPSAFADRDKTVAFANDLSLSVTRQEFADALLGYPSPEFLESADQLLEFVHVDFRFSLPNKTSIASFIKSVGNVLPLEYREILRSYRDNSFGFDDGTPANPSVCSTAENIEKFKGLRQQILSGRATKQQMEDMFCDLQDDNLDDLELIAEIAQKGVGDYVSKKIPPIQGTPGCDDGLLPYEPPQTIDAVLGFNGAILEALENDYLDDMMGTGFTLFGSGDRNFGFLNMVLCDTKANPLTNHHRKADNRKRYVDFATNITNGGETNKSFFSFIQTKADFTQQEGQLPFFVGEWMKRQFLNAGLPESETSGFLKPGFNNINAGGTDLMGLEFSSTNAATSRKDYKVDLERLGYDNLFGNQGLSTFLLPDFGYNTIVTNMDGTYLSDVTTLEGILDATGGIPGSYVPPTVDADRKVVITRLPRKGNPDRPGGRDRVSGADITLNFKDNSMGTRQGLEFGSNKGGNEWSYGYEIQCFYADIEEHRSARETEGKIRNRPDDNIRVAIVEKINYGADRKFASPLAKELAAESQRLPPFDLPGWIEGVPILGWALESLINLVMLPFSALRASARMKRAYNKSEAIHRFRTYEFLAIDDGLDAFQIDSSHDQNKEKSLDINDFPEYFKSTRSLQSIPPQVHVLADLTGKPVSATLQSNYDSAMQTFYKDFCKLIGENKYAWRTGAVPDLVNEDALEYGIDNGFGDFVLYQDANAGRGYDNEEMVLGMTRDQFNNKSNPEAARVIVLDPTVFGGTFNDPPLHVKPKKYLGWWGMVQAFFPDDTSCKPHGKNLIDFDEIKQMMSRNYSSLEEDTRLYNDLECVRQVPFDRILTRSAKMNLYTLILAAVRIYASTHIMKAIGTFATIQPKFPDNFSTIYSAYIVERMEEDFKNAQPAFWEAFNTFKDEEFWYSFLEQSVECYDFLVAAGELDEPVKGGYIQTAADAINDLQTNYAYAYRTKDERTYTDQDGIKRNQVVPGLWEAKFTGEAGFFETLKGYRERKNLEGVKYVEDHAKIFLQQLVNYELTNMGEKFVKNMTGVGFVPDIFDLDYWLFQNKCVGSTIQYHGPSIVEEKIGVPSRRNPDPADAGATFPGPYYTGGGEFRVAIDKNTEDGFGYSEKYVGYYHIHLDDDGNEVYMAGQIHDPGTTHDVLTPVADIIKISTEKTELAKPTILGDELKVTKSLVGIGDVADFETASGTSPEQPFKLEKYTSIDNIKMTDAAAKTIIHSNPADKYISDVYPGTLKIITNEANIEVGIEGNLGVRHGLAFYYGDDLVTTVEVDALDYACGQFETTQANSKLLHCLIQNLKHDPKYKLITSYIFAIKKVTATLAIYNDFGFLASVGEVTAGEGDNHVSMQITAKEPKKLENGMAEGLKGKVSQRHGPSWRGSSGSTTAQRAAIQSKPGSRAFIKQTVESDFMDEFSDRDRELLNLPEWYDNVIELESIELDAANSYVTGNEGWEWPTDRPKFTPFTLSWDEWDRELLRNSRARIKKMFRTFYKAAYDKPGPSPDRQSPAKLKLRNLKARLFPAPGSGFMPWWKRKKMKGNPYDADGNMCDGPDILG